MSIILPSIVFKPAESIEREDPLVTQALAARYQF